MFGGMGGCRAEGTKVIWGPAHPHQETIEGREEARAELGECRAVRAGEGGLLYRHTRGLVLQDYVIQEGADRPGNCVGVEGADGFFVGIGGDSYQVERWMSGLGGSGKEFCGEQGEGVVYGENLGFCVKVPSGGSLRAASSNAEGSVL